MNNNINGRLKALEAHVPSSLVLLVEDADGNQFECTVDEFEAHGAPTEHTTPAGTKVMGREWEFKRILRGASIEEAFRVLDASFENSAF